MWARERVFIVTYAVLDYGQNHKAGPQDGDIEEKKVHKGGHKPTPSKRKEIGQQTYKQVKEQCRFATLTL